MSHELEDAAPYDTLRLIEDMNAGYLREHQSSAHNKGHHFQNHFQDHQAREDAGAAEEAEDTSRAQSLPTVIARGVVAIVSDVRSHAGAELPPLQRAHALLFAPDRWPATVAVATAVVVLVFAATRQPHSGHGHHHHRLPEADAFDATLRKIRRMCDEVLLSK